MRGSPRLSELIRKTSDVAPAHRPGCCGCSAHGRADLSRRGLLGGSVLDGVALTVLSWARWAGAAGDCDEPPCPPPRRPLVVKPVLIYKLPRRRPQTTRRSWGGLQTEDDGRQETARIAREPGHALKKIPIAWEYLG